jgi:hypothetical protein
VETHAHRSARGTREKHTPGRDVNHSSTEQKPEIKKKLFSSNCKICELFFSFFAFFCAGLGPFAQLALSLCPRHPHFLNVLFVFRALFNFSAESGEKRGSSGQQ